MKRMYKTCAYEITVTSNRLTMGCVTPAVKIHIVGEQTMLTTNETFLNTEFAEEYGEAMAHEWIDAHAQA